MKKRTMLLMSMTLAVLLIAGGTLAWFTATADPVVNEFTAGTVDLEIIDEFDGAPNVNPGDCYKKVIAVKNTGTKKAYIRIKADAVFDGGQSLDVLKYGIDGPNIWNFLDGWTEIDGYFYYNRIVYPGHYTKPLLKCNRICFDGEKMDNDYQGAKLDITINAEAIQATNGAIQAEWGVSFPTVMPFSDQEQVEEMITLADFQAIVAEQDAAFEALGLE